MADEKSRDKTSDIAKNIWLAGLGAYGKALSDAKGRLDEAAKEPPRLFRELVEKGVHLEDEFRDSLASMRKSRANSLEDRINRVRESFNFHVTRGDEINEINRKLDALTAKVDALSAAIDGAAPKKKTPAKRKAAAKKGTAAKKKSAAASKKAPAKRKAATRKTAARKRPAAKKKAPATRRKSR